MGVLEDAIREHLELKRRHGASEEEVERKELEALGPARREFEAPAGETAEDESQPVEPASGPALADEKPPAPGPEPELLEPETELPPESAREPGGPEATRLRESPLEATRMHEPPAEQPPAADAPDFADEDDDEDEPRRDRPLDFDFD